MTPDPRIVTLGIDGLWMPMDFARLMHLVVRYYRLEQLVHLARTGGRNFFDDRLDAVVLKYLAAFDWIAAPLMSGKYNQSYIESEDFVRDFGMADLRVHSVSYASPGHVAFLGIGAIMDGLYGAFHSIRQIKEPSRFITGDSPDKFADIEAMYGANLKLKANLMKDAGYSDAELNAIVSPSIEDLHFISNAMTQGRIVTVEKRPLAR
jgi:hypothetical protein